MVIFNNLFFIVTLTAALGCGLIAGLFFAFSISVMKALSLLPPEEGISAMQSINVTIINPVFMMAFFGTSVACVFLIISSLMHWNDPGVVYLFVGGTIYLVGSLLVTLVFNVPMNDALASVAPTDPEGAKLWADYLKNWTFWNHIRTVASLGVATLLTIALCH